jgi:hypothetical protein
MERLAAAYRVQGNPDYMFEFVDSIHTRSKARVADRAHFPGRPRPLTCP